MSAEQPTLPLVCSRCGREVAAKIAASGEPKLPKGWKRLPAPACKECIKAAYVPRCIWLPVASAAVEYRDADWSEADHKAGWQALWSSLRESWRTAAQLYNWALVEFARTDSAFPVPSKKGGGIVPGPWDRKAAVTTVRALVRARFPDVDERIDSQSKYALLAKAEADYYRSRFERQVLCKVTLPETLSGRLPLPVPLDSLNRVWVGDDRVFLRLRLAGRRYTLRLAGTGGHQRGVRTLEACLAGQGQMGELKVQERGDKVMVGFSVLLPREACERSEVVIRVQTGKDKIWGVFVDGREEPWDLNDDQFRQAMTAYKARLRRISDDLKMERRRPHENSRSFEEARQQMARDYANRSGDYCHKAAAILAGLARRQKACRVEYDDSEQGYLPGGPYFKLRARVAEKLAALAVEFVHVNASGGPAAG